MHFAWLAFLLLVCCTCVFSRLIVAALIFFIERFLVMKINKTFYFLFSLKTSVHYFLFSSLILLSWFFYLKSVMHIFLVHFITSTLVTFVIANGMWMLKILVFKLLDCHFHDKNFFQKIQNLISHEYILQTLLRETKYSNKNAILKMIQGAMAYMRFLVCTRVHTICDALENSVFEDDQHKVENVIFMVYKNLTNNELRDIQERDLLRVMKKEDMANFLRLLEGSTETKSISEASFRKWMVNVYNERKSVVHLLNNTSSVIEQLNKIVSVTLLFLVALVWCHLMGGGATTFLVYIASHLLLIIIFGDYCKMICEGIKLAILMHPFNIGDHCIIDNEQLVVEEIGLINTVFLKDNNEKMSCLNSVLLTKSISNLNRTSDLRAAFELLVSGTTSSDTISALKLQIDKLLKSKPEIWRAEHCFDLIGIDDMTHKYNLKVTHARNFQNYNEMSYQRSELVVNLRKLMEELNIKIFTLQ